MREWCEKWLQVDLRPHPQLEKLVLETAWFCGELFRDPRRGFLLVLYGRNGCAKTHIARAVHRWCNLCLRGEFYVVRPGVVRPPRVDFWNWADLLGYYKKGGWEITEDLIETDLLILDELGGGHDPSQAGTDQLCQILSAREGKFTLVATNLSPDQWEEKFDRRIASRLFRQSTLVDLSEVPDYSLWIQKYRPKAKFGMTL